MNDGRSNERRKGEREEERKPREGKKERREEGRKNKWRSERKEGGWKKNLIDFIFRKFRVKYPKTHIKSQKTKTSQNNSKKKKKKKTGIITIPEGNYCESANKLDIIILHNI